MFSYIFLCRLDIGKIICFINETSINSNLFMLDINAHIPHLDLKLFSYFMPKPVPRTIFFLKPVPTGSWWWVSRLGLPGIIHGVEIATDFFTGNFAPKASLQAAR
jgi:hypothetical protein